MSEPVGFWHAHATGILLERGSPAMSGHNVTAAAVYCGHIVSYEIAEGERRASERAAKAAERVRDALNRPRGGMA